MFPGQDRTRSSAHSVASSPGAVADRLVEPPHERQQRREISLQDCWEPWARDLALRQHPGRGEGLVAKPPRRWMSLGVAAREPGEHRLLVQRAEAAPERPPLDDPIETLREVRDGLPDAVQRR